MSEDELKVEATEPAKEAVVPKKKGKGKLIVLIAILVVLAAGGGGFWIWHEQPSFCNAICHTPMDPYNATYDAVPGAATVDKWDNAVSDASAMLAVTHREAGEGCLDCHVPTIGEQLSEGLSWVTGDYWFPLSQRTLADLTSARKLQPDDFCLKSGCHHEADDGTVLDSREALLAATDQYIRNPHKPQHGVNDCGDCHNAHRASVNFCSQCHKDAPLPDGWLDYNQASQIIQY
jgi:hypothetical protein